MEEVIEMYPNDMIWITGDINLPHVDWENNTVQNSSYPVPLYDIFLDFLSIHSFTQMVNFPTRGNNILDIFCCNRPALITMCKPLPGISDHDILFITSLLSVKINPPVKRKIYLWSRAKNEDIQNKASELCNHFMKLPINTLSINDLWQNFKNICIRCLEMVVCIYNILLSESDHTIESY